MVGIGEIDEISLSRQFLHDKANGSRAGGRSMAKDFGLPLCRLKSDPPMYIFFKPAREMLP